MKTRLERRRWFRRRFCQIEQVGTSVSIRSGIVGQPGVETREELGSELDAIARHNLLVNDRIREGWTETARQAGSRTPPEPYVVSSLEELIARCEVDEHAWETDQLGDRPGPRVPPLSFDMPTGELARNAELEALIIERDHDDDWRVYADWLVSQGDELGAYINQCMDGQGEAELAARLRPLWLGEALATHLAQNHDSCFRMQWRRGLIHRAWVSVEFDYEGDIETLLAALLDSPAARFLRGLQIGLGEWDGTNIYTGLAQVFRERAPLISIEHLFIGNYAYPEQTEISWTEVGDISEVPGCFPRLRDYRVRGGLIEFGALRHARIERLGVESGGLNLEAVKSIMGAELPRLRELELWTGDEGYGAEANLGDLAPLLEGRFESLEVLRLRNTELSNQFVEGLVGSRLLPRLRVLDLSMGTLHGVGVRALVDNPENFAHLERLDLRDNFLTAAEIATVTSALPNAVVGDNGQKEPWAQGEALRYYVSVGE